jgi:lipid-binding SYLF domain-containing protein
MKNAAQKTPLTPMGTWSRRGFILSAGAGMTAACSGGTKNRARDRIDSNVARAVQDMKILHPFTVELADNAAGMLVMPKIRKAGFGLGGSYGEGSLLIGGATVDYYNLIAASFGFQAGAQQFSSVLFFMDSDNLRSFRERDGWTLGADLEFTLLDSAAGAAGIDNNTYPDAVYAIVFNQAGLLVGASLEGAKYSRIVR